MNEKCRVLCPNALFSRRRARCLLALEGEPSGQDKEDLIRMGLGHLVQQLPRRQRDKNRQYRCLTVPVAKKGTRQVWVMLRNETELEELQNDQFGIMVGVFEDRLPPGTIIWEDIQMGPQLDSLPAEVDPEQVVDFRDVWD